MTAMVSGIVGNTEQCVGKLRIRTSTLLPGRVHDALMPLPGAPTVSAASVWRCMASRVDSGRNGQYQQSGRVHPQLHYNECYSAMVRNAVQCVGKLKIRVDAAAGQGP